MKLKINETKEGEKSDQDITTHVLHNLPLEFENFVMKQHEKMAELQDGEEMDYEEFERDLEEHCRRMTRLRTIRKNAANKSEDFSYFSIKSPKLKLPFKKQFKGRCKFCGKIGHKEDECFKKNKGIANKQRFEFKGQGKFDFYRDGPKISGKCNWCGIVGHMETHCRKKKAGNPRSGSCNHCTTMDRNKEVVFVSLNMK